MLNTQMIVEGNVASDIQLRHTPAGTAVADVIVLANSGRRTNGEYQPDEPTRIRVTAWDRLAENLAASAATGDRLVIVGRMHTEVYPDRDTGEKRTSQKVTADAIGYSLRFHTLTAQKNTPHRNPAEQAGNVRAVRTRCAVTATAGREWVLRGTCTPGGPSHLGPERTTVQTHHDHSSEDALQGWSLAANCLLYEADPEPGRL
ncbi:MAG: single-stranded DNA-binding protein, partial [Stackebrandtia sp.]